MTIFRRAASLFAALLLLAWPGVFAAEQTGSIAVGMTYQNEAIPGGSITLYRIADLGADLRYIPAAEFADCGLDWNGPLSPADAEKLADHAERNRIPGQTRSLGTDGTAFFSPLETGLYLLVQREAGKGFLPVKPFFAGIPQQIGGELRYHVDASPKCAPVPNAPGDPPGLPQTGQLRWPVPVLTVLGLWLMAAGLLLYRRDEHDP